MRTASSDNLLIRSDHPRMDNWTAKRRSSRSTPNRSATGRSPAAGRSATASSSSSSEKEIVNHRRATQQRPGTVLLTSPLEPPPAPFPACSVPLPWLLLPAGGPWNRRPTDRPLRFPPRARALVLIMLSLKSWFVSGLRWKTEIWVDQGSAGGNAK